MLSVRRSKTNHKTLTLNHKEGSDSDAPPDLLHLQLYRPLSRSVQEFLRQTRDSIYDLG
jgi:hypothetical protein